MSTCSFGGKFHPAGRNSDRFPLSWGVKQDMGKKTSHFLALNVSISKTSKVIIVTNRIVRLFHWHQNR